MSFNMLAVVYGGAGQQGSVIVELLLAQPALGEATATVRDRHTTCQRWKWRPGTRFVRGRTMALWRICCFATVESTTSVFRDQGLVTSPQIDEPHVVEACGPPPGVGLYRK